mmetsp:Transcript_16312/g.46430  ORF Transcript_16312/g.46430 Transcript_16312/m.46430 type:complete len:264 (-) Transcript_16312:809-1600(-)
MGSLTPSLHISSRRSNASLAGSTSPRSVQLRLEQTFAVCLKASSDRWCGEGCVSDLPTSRSADPSRSCRCCLSRGRRQSAVWAREPAGVSSLAGYAFVTRYTESTRSRVPLIGMAVSWRSTSAMPATFAARVSLTDADSLSTHRIDASSRRSSTSWWHRSSSSSRLSTIPIRAAGRWSTPPNSLLITRMREEWEPACDSRRDIRLIRISGDPCLPSSNHCSSHGMNVSLWKESITPSTDAARASLSRLSVMPSLTTAPESIIS